MAGLRPTSLRLARRESRAPYRLEPRRIGRPRRACSPITLNQLSALSCQLSAVRWSVPGFSLVPGFRSIGADRLDQILQRPPRMLSRILSDAEDELLREER